MGNFGSKNSDEQNKTAKTNETWQSRIRHKKKVRKITEFKDSGIDAGYEGDTEKPTPGVKDQQEHELNMLQEHHLQQVEEANLSLFSGDERFFPRYSAKKIN